MRTLSSRTHGDIARATTATIFRAHMAFVLAGFGMLQAGGHSRLFRVLGPAPLPTIAWGVLGLFALGAFLVLMAAGIPLYVGIALRALAARRRDLWLLLAPLPGLAVFVLAGGVGGYGPLSALLPSLVCVAVGVSAALGSSFAVARAAARSDLRRAFFQGALAPGAILTGAMAAMLLCAAAFTFGAAFSAPHVFFTGDALGGTTPALSLGACLVVMLVSTLVALVALGRALLVRPALRGVVRAVGWLGEPPRQHTQTPAIAALRERFAHGELDMQTLRHEVGRVLIEP